MNTRPAPSPRTHAWVSQATARALGYDPDALPASIGAEPVGTWPPRNELVVQVPQSALHDQLRNPTKGIHQ